MPKEGFWAKTQIRKNLFREAVLTVRRVPTRCGQVAVERYVIKRFGRKSRISPRIPDFSGFLLDQVTRGDLRIPKNQTL